MNWSSSKRLFHLLVFALLAWHAVESWRVRPHYLTYFNALAGGPAQGHRYFVDSSLDWGQGLPDLAFWLNRHAKGERLFLSYFGTDEPERFGIKATRIGDHLFNYTGDPNAIPTLHAGVYCISATMFRRVYTEVSGAWNLNREVALRRFNANDTPKDPAKRRTFEQLRFGRLCQFLESRPPTAIIANSILVFRLTEEDLTTALGQSHGI